MTDMTISVFDMNVRTGNWGRVVYLLPHFAHATVELMPADAAGVLVRVLEGVTPVPRELRVEDVESLTVATSSGKPRLVLRPAQGTVERLDGGSLDGAWELQIEGGDQRSLHLYARKGTPAASEELLDALATVVATATE